MKKNIFGGVIFTVLLLSLFLFPFATSFFDKSLSEISVKDSNYSPWYLSNEKKDYALVYYGYVGCTTICIPSLKEIIDLYKKIDERNLDIPFYFVNIDPTIDPELPNLFVKSFDKRFNGVYLDNEQLKIEEKEFNLLISKGKLEINHSSNLYLFKKTNSRFLLDKIYITHPYDDKALLKNFE